MIEFEKRPLRSKIALHKSLKQCMTSRRHELKRPKVPLLNVDEWKSCFSSFFLRTDDTFVHQLFMENSNLKKKF